MKSLLADDAHLSAPRQKVDLCGERRKRKRSLSCYWRPRGVWDKGYATLHGITIATRLYSFLSFVLILVWDNFAVVVFSAGCGLGSAGCPLGFSRGCLRNA